MFNATTFDTGRGIDNMIVFDQNGIFSSTFPYNGNPANNGDTPAWALSWLGSGLYQGGYITDFLAFDAKCLGATFHEGQNHAVTQVDGKDNRPPPIVLTTASREHPERT